MPITDNQATILILGADGVDGPPSAPSVNGVNNPDDTTNPTGRNGTDGSYTWDWDTLKYVCTCATSGTPGANAPKAGGNGNHGTAGDKAPDFTIQVDTYVGNLIILSRGGKGGTGSVGGNGGNGDKGGDAGTNNKSCIKNGKCQYQSGGQGGNASDGGRGGDAGKGGDGGTITILYQNTPPLSVAPYTMGGPAGLPGDGGQAGTPGKGGANEAYGSDPPTYAPDGNNATQPGGGRGADPGLPGKVSFSPVGRPAGGGQQPAPPAPSASPTP
jgi:hypothetical protein